MIPNHVAIIMDGNRRWAKEKGLLTLSGHRHVADKVLEPLIEHAANLGIKFITFWAWSTENWKRSQEEVKGIMKIFRTVMKRSMDRLHKKGVRIKTVGDISRFDKDIRQALEDAVEKTKNNQKITATFALNYGGRDEIVRAINKLLGNSKLQTPNSKLSQKQFSNLLDTSSIPDPDLIVRTSGEKRLSGFLPWQSVYSELFFVDWHMPDFTPDRLDEVLAEFTRRQRRFGK